MLAATLGSAALVTVSAAPAYAGTPTTFSYTGAAQTYTIPAGTTKLQVVIKGAQGGGTNGGPGGAVTAVITTPAGLGDKIQVMVGGRGASATPGWNGGGDSTYAFGGGGATDLRQGTCAATSSCALADRTVIAGGGGGGEPYDGGGGGYTPVPAYDMTLPGAGYGRQGAAATQSAGGAGGANAGAGVAGLAGSLGTGGDGGAGGPGTMYGSGGGGGRYGGGGGGGTTSMSRTGGPGGGGTSWADPTRLDSAATYSDGDRYNDGTVTITTVGPAAPSGVSASVTAGTGAASLQWTAPAGGADSYVVYGGTSASGPWTAVASGACAGVVTATSCAITGLTPGTTYYYAVSSVLTGAEGDMSTAVSVTAIGPPAAPGSVAALVSGDVAMSVSWPDPSTPAAPATNFQVLVSVDSGSFVAVSAGTCSPGTVTSPCTVTGLTAGSSYRFKVLAVNDAGTSTAAGPSTAVVAVAAPGAPTPGTVAASGSGAVTVAWTGPGGPVTGYKVYASVSAGPYVAVAAGTCLGTPTASPCTVTGLTLGLTYHFKISAVTSAVEGAQSVASTGVLAIGVPLSPLVPSLTLSGDRAIQVTWLTTPNPLGPASGFLVQVSKDSGPYTTVTTGACAAPSASPCVLSGLDAGASYQVQVIATNVAGAGSASPPSVALVAVAGPGAPTITGVVPGAGQLTVTWTPAPSTGSVVYHAVAAPTGLTTPTFECTEPAPGVSCAITGLANGTGYTVTVYALGAVASTSSAGHDATPSIAPGTPTVTAVAGNASIAVTWTPGAAGSGVHGYRVTATPGSATCSAGPSGTGCVLGAEAGQTYTVSVVAEGTYGRDSAAGVSSSVTPAAPPVPAAPPTPNATLTTDKGDISTAVPNQQITVIGHGFAPFSTVTVTLYSSPVVLAHAVADASGDVHQAVTVPADLAAGQHTLVALGVDTTGTAHTVSVVVTVTATPTSLPVTGIALNYLLMVALTLLGAGTALRFTGRRPHLR